MAITTAWLKDQGLTEEQIQAVFAERGKEITAGKAELLAEQAKHADYEAMKTNYEKQGKDLDALKKLDPEKLQEQLNTMSETHKTELENMKTAAAENVKKMAVKMALGEAHDADMVLSQLDLTAVELDDKGNVSKGLTEQLITLKESKAFLFKPAESTTTPPPSGYKPSKPGESEPNSNKGLRMV